jgi:PAS domain S-box-containing protein
MNIYSLFSFIASALCIYLIVKTLIKDSKSKLNLIFSVLCFSMFIHTFFFGITYLMKLKEEVVLVMNFFYIGLYTFLPLLFHFCLIITKTKIKPWILFFNYLPVLLFIIANIMGINLFFEYIKYKGEWTGVININLYYLYLFHIIVILTINSIIIYKWGRKTKSNKEKIYSRFLFISSILTYLIGQTFSFILPIFKIYGLQPVGLMTFYVYIFGLYFLVSNLRFLNLNYSFLADEILSNINDMVLILDADFKIVNVNNNFNKIIADNSEKFMNKNYFEIVADNEKLKAKINEIDETKLNSLNIRIDYHKDDEYIITNSYISRIKDKYNDLTGYLIISSEIKEIKQFQKYFKITNRELEIIEYIISGHTYKEVSNHLNITEKTVESHLTHIYNKLNANNKIELVKLAGEFNIKPYLKN